MVSREEFVNEIKKWRREDKPDSDKLNHEELKEWQTDVTREIVQLPSA